MRIRCDGLAGSEVAVAGASGEFAFAARRDDIDLHRAEGSVFFSVSRVVAKRVLVADIARDLVTDVVHVIDVFREKRNAALLGWLSGLVIIACFALMILHYRDPL